MATVSPVSVSFHRWARLSLSVYCCTFWPLRAVPPLTSTYMPLFAFCRLQWALVSSSTRNFCALVSFAL